MHSALYKKIVGTTMLFAMAGGGVLTTYSVVQAKFIATNKVISVDGIVNSVDLVGRTITLNTDSSSPITFLIKNRTKFGVHLRLQDISAGDHLSILGNVSSDGYTADLIKRIASGPGYGTQGDHVLVETGTITSKGANTFTIEVNGVSVTFDVTLSTDFILRSFANLQVGDVVLVHGRDNGTNFEAAQVLFRPHATNHDNGNGNGNGDGEQENSNQ